jgi:hypothetical protein
MFTVINTFWKKNTLCGQIVDLLGAKEDAI